MNINGKKAVAGIKIPRISGAITVNAPRMRQWCYCHAVISANAALFQRPSHCVGFVLVFCYYYSSRQRQEHCQTLLFALNAKLDSFCEWLNSIHLPKSHSTPHTPETPPSAITVQWSVLGYGKISANVNAGLQAIVLGSGLNQSDPVWIRPW